MSAQPSMIIVVFNIHVDDSNDAYAVEFLDMLESMGFMQHVDVPTHEQSHTLDLVITRQFHSIILHPPTIGQFFSDHAVVHCSLNSVNHASVLLKTYRQLKSALCSDKTTDLDELVGCYNSTLSSLMNRRAPLQTKRVTNRLRILWFNGEIKSAIRVRIAERKWRKTKSESDLAAFKQRKIFLNKKGSLYVLSRLYSTK